MSTRSGKRIHKSLHENLVVENDHQSEFKTERKTRSRRLKENCDILNISLPKTKKKHNYVSYPTDDGDIIITKSQTTETDHGRTVRKNALKELNIEVNEATNCTESVSKSDFEPVQKVTRQTRRTKKFTETTDDENIQNGDTQLDTKDTTPVVSKKKKNTKKKQPKEVETLVETDTKVRLDPQKKSRRKRKGGKSSNSHIVEDVFKTASKNKSKSLNNTNTSADSFHSAAGSPTSNNVYISLNGTLTKSPASKLMNQEPHTILGKVADKLSVSCCDDKSAEKASKRKRSSRLSQVKINFDNDAEEPQTIVAVLNTTFDTDNASQTNNHLDTTFSKDSKSPRKSLRISQSISEAQNTISDKTKIINTTFDKSADSRVSDTAVLNSTFDKETKISDSNSKLSSDSSDLNVNVTFDKSSDNISRISITSDDSKQLTENILNATPVLIESSIDTSNITDNSPEPTKPASTPVQLKREGTFTKDGPEPILVEKKNSTNCNTPIKGKMSLPSPGCTPFHSNTKVPHREKSAMNITHSIEKPTRLSSLVETGRSTKVMFCSPVDNPIWNTQRKSKVIKSSMKGSNKSFLFDDKGTSTQSSSRKRSYTQTVGEESRVKRQRLADDIQQSVDRLSRPRTSSAQGKPTETTPVKKPVTPRAKSETKARKLPNFAALHQKQFQKMESLDECQERKAKRAKQLLVPTGSIAVLDRSSPKMTTANISTSTSTKEVEIVKQPPATKTDPKKGYTRFGYKLNLDVNPFSIPSKTPAKETVRQDPKKPIRTEVLKKVSKIPFNGGLKRLPTLPSLSGVTEARRDVAKKVIMREKTASTLKDLGNMKRNENRTIIKGVRTNRRFELQMKTRNIHG